MISKLDQKTNQSKLFGQIQRESRPLVQLAFDRDLTSMRLHQLLGDGQSQAASGLAGTITAPETVKNKG